MLALQKIAVGVLCSIILIGAINCSRKETTESTSFSRKYAQWRETLAAEMRTKSWASGDTVLLDKLGVGAPENLPFLRNKLENDEFAVLVLESSSLYKEAMSTNYPIGMRDKADFWMNWIDQRKLR